MSNKRKKRKVETKQNAKVYKVVEKAIKVKKFFRVNMKIENDMIFLFIYFGATNILASLWMLMMIYENVKVFDVCCVYANQRHLLFDIRWLACILFVRVLHKIAEFIEDLREKMIPLMQHIWHIKTHPIWWNRHLFRNILHLLKCQLNRRINTLESIVNHHVYSFIKEENETVSSNKI